MFIVYVSVEYFGPTVYLLASEISPYLLWYDRHHKIES